MANGIASRRWTNSKTPDNLQRPRSFPAPPGSCRHSSPVPAHAPAAPETTASAANADAAIMSLIWTWARPRPLAKNPHAGQTRCFHRAPPPPSRNTLEGVWVGSSWSVKSSPETPRLSVGQIPRGRDGFLEQMSRWRWASPRETVMPPERRSQGKLGPFFFFFRSLRLCWVKPFVSAPLGFRPGLKGHGRGTDTEQQLVSHFVGQVSKLPGLCKKTLKVYPSV